MERETRPAPDWAGDVSLGVDAWTGAREAKQARDRAQPPPQDRFEEVGLVDDEAFARSWVAGRQAAKGLARRALAQELRRKGVDDEVAREVLDELEPEQEEQAARTLVRKKLRSLSRVDDVTATRRLVGMLARKGYGSGMAFAVVRDELSRAGRDDPTDDGDLD